MSSRIVSVWRSRGNAAAVTARLSSSDPLWRVSLLGHTLEV